jgi:hypothetical protein
MAFSSGHLAEHPLPPGITGALSLGGYQLLADVGGVGAGRLGSQAFLVIAPEPGPGADVGTQISLHQTKLRDEVEAAAYVQLAAQLGFLRLSGYRVALERSGLRSKLALVNPASGAVAVTIPDRAGGRLFGAGATAPVLLAGAHSLAPAGPPPNLQQPEALREVLLALALADDSLDGAGAAEAADRALGLIRGDATLDPARALEAAKETP